ncbi:hypothetical protein PRCB_02235 [Pantoea rodasii]|uniref:Uncharacterized protein n=1 Tax=Pantoea rodasii TaxID=1076549 RepID=A0A2M9WJ68_9GAMM|nr:hypothetical protein [Pantoea rodasii]ORM64348.1 hypothetical protein HA45_11105 [Pantoea rodasii]PJZ07498.1 hypothetical protein PRCB_02235 [Pantoea rodasii]
MFKIIYNIFVKSAVLILLVLSLWLVINGALKQSDSHFEFGSLMDFFNTLGTIGTLLVAYLVYKNAPKWLHQKQEEDGYALLKELILNDYYDYYMSWFRMSHKLSMLAFNLRFISRNPDLFVTVKDCDQFISSIRDLEIKPTIINHKFNNLIKLKIVVNDEVKELHASMISFSEKLSHHNLRAWRKTRSLLINEDASVEDYENISQEILSLSAKVNTLMSEFKGYSDSISYHSENLNDYFTIANR